MKYELIKEYLGEVLLTKWIENGTWSQITQAMEAYHLEMDRLEEIKSSLRTIWRFSAYESEKKAENDDPFFIGEFLDHTRMKIFSAKHSARYKPLYDDYCSNYETLKKCHIK